MYNQATDFVRAQNNARAYIELMRFAQLITTLPGHNNYQMTQYQKERNLNKRRLENAIIKMEELKPRLIAEYELQIQQEKQNAAKQKPKSEQKPAQKQGEQTESKAAAPKQAKKQPQNRWNNLTINPQSQVAPNSNSNSNSNGLQLQQPQAQQKQKPKKKLLDSLFGKSKTLSAIFVPANLVQGFVRHAAANTARDVETCAVLTGKFLHDQDAYLVTHCIVPKQKGSANTVQTLHEEELIGVQEKYGVVTLGWIHSHPSQTCFLSSVDMHCQLSYQIMMRNAIAIVYAPTDKTLVFSLTDAGIDLLSKCNCQGFHRHDQSNAKLYDQAQHVHFANECQCKFIDLR